MSRAPGTIVLDAGSRTRFDEAHVAGAINRRFPDIAVVSLAQALPDKNARILGRLLDIAATSIALEGRAAPAR